MPFVIELSSEELAGVLSAMYQRPFSEVGALIETISVQTANQTP